MAKPRSSPIADASGLREHLCAGIVSIAFALFVLFLSSPAALARLDPPIDSWGTGIQFRFPTTMSADFFNRAEIIPYAFYFADNAASVGSQNLSFTIEPKLIFRVDLERGSLTSVKFRVGGKMVVSDVELETSPLLIVDQTGQGFVFDPSTMMPTINGVSHTDLSRAANQIKKGLAEMESAGASIIKLNPEQTILIEAAVKHARSECERTAQPTLPQLESHFAVIQNLEEKIEFQSLGAEPVLDEKTTQQIHEAWLRLIRENPALFEKFPRLQLRLRYPWRDMKENKK